MNDIQHEDMVYGCKEEEALEKEETESELESALIYTEGYEDGYSDGRLDGYTDGYDKARREFNK